MDYAAAAMCAVLIFGLLFHASSGTRLDVRPGVTPGWLLVLLLAAGLSFPVAIRRRAPARALAIVLIACLVTLILGGEITRGPFLPLGVVLYLVASTCRRTIAVAGLAGALALLVAQGVALHFSGVGAGNAIAVGLVLTILWMIGFAVQQRRTYLAHLRDRAASDAVTRERLRIARELHDVVAHSMTVVTVQAGFGEYVFDSQPSEARAALGAIQSVSREALSEMQRMLCVLRQPDAEITPAASLPAGAADAPAAGRDAAASRPAAASAGPAGEAAGAGGDGRGWAGLLHAGLSRAGLLGPALAGAEPDQAGLARTDGAAGAAAGAAERDRPQAPLAPAPGLASLDRLVERTAGAGVKVTVERSGQVRSLPAGLDLSAFRIVQEGLTNVVKHSGADRCHVVLHYGTKHLLVKVIDPGPGARAEPAPAAIGSRAQVLAGTGYRARAAASAMLADPVLADPGPGGPGPDGSGPDGPGPGGSGPGCAVRAGSKDQARAAWSRPVPRAGHGVPRAGHGIVGMRERVGLLGGDFTAAPRPEGGFLVRARLPLGGAAS
jgi:signal transduction histidine kinase